jgi:poly(3-hydroxybutyrate) depolymerase
MRSRRLSSTCLAALTVAVIGCSSAGSSSDGGSPSGSGGATGKGGAEGTGGVQGTGGSPSTGGAQGTGGLPGSGGSQGSGGVQATGGVQGSGGTGGSSGTTGTGGGAGAGGRGGHAGGGAAGGSAGSGGASAGAGGGSAGRGGNGGQTGADAGTGNPVASTGCGKTPSLKNSPTATANQNTLTISGTSRQFLIRWPSNYDNSHPYRLILDFHGATGKDTDLAPSYFGLFDLSKNTTIFVAPSADGGIWNATTDATFVDEILKAVEADLCIDTSRIELEGFSQGGAMVAVLACGRPGIFRAAVGHSRGGLTAPTSCQPIPYLGSLGLQDIAGNSQATQTDPFAKWDGCTNETLPTAPTGGHVCTAYKNCMAADPVIWCSFDGPHTASPTDSGQTTSWMPAEVWPFLSQF